VYSYSSFVLGVKNITTGAKTFSTLITALVLFGLAASVILVTVPHFFTGSERPGFMVFLVAGIVVIILTAALFGYIDRLDMGFGKTALVLAAGYNALIAAVKLGLAPAAMYAANQERTFTAQLDSDDPNSPWFYIVVGVAVLFLYLIVFRVMYWFFKRRFQRRAGAQLSSASTGQVNGQRTRRGILVALTVVVIAILAPFFWIVPVFLVAMPTLSYLSYVFATFGVAIALALGLAAILAYRTFDQVEKQAAYLKDATLLANFFWFGLALILLYHAMWAVFLLTLVSIWPFRTYTPK
jgi:hypothetical protein